MKLRLVLLILAAAFCTRNGNLQAATRLTIGYSTINPRIAPLWIAQEKGYFQRYGVDTTLVFVRSTPLLIAAMKSGNIPVAYGAGSGILNASVSESETTRYLPSLTDEMEYMTTKKASSSVTRSP